jgi:hypothetical protein
MYDHEKFLGEVSQSLAKIAFDAEKEDSKPPIMALMQLVTSVFTLGHAINENLNRIAVALEAEQKIMQADNEEHVAQKINDGVELALAKREKRAYIGKHD